jgi:starch-binding outer membrane protein, SusD/RagB family
MLTFKSTMMRKLLYILFVSFGLLSLGCKKQLDQQPISDLSSDLFWKTAEHALLGNAAIYDGVQKTLSGNFTDWGDARSDNFTYGGTGENQINVVLNGLNATTPGTNWNNLYMTIGRANVAIKYVPTIKELSEVNKNHYLAQAYALRAYMYWYGVRVWGNLPVVSTPYEDINIDPSVPRSAADSIINGIIIPDLEKALTLLDKNAARNAFEINDGSILSILADVYLWKKDYAKVLSTTDRLTALNRYGLAATTSYKDMLVLASTNEPVWFLHWSYLVDGGNAIAGKIGSSDQTSNYYIDSVPLLKWETNKVDIRRGINYDTLVANALQRVIQIWKFYPLGANGRPAVPARAQNEAKLPLYRWADILLMRAEALNWGSNDKTGAITIVNQIRTRARAGNVNAALYNNFATQLDVEKAILDERQLELFAEGKRFFDLVRTDRVLQVMDPLIRQRQRNLGLAQTGFTDPRKILWPISRDALTRNVLLVQNPPYTD